ncbi:MAG: hypothetical protein Q9214_003924, partial [Letrouitia sp. 1 TL-2023]
MSNGPLPSTLVFINDLQSLAQGEKSTSSYQASLSVNGYDTSTGTLTVHHAYPPPPHTCVVALVDVNILLSTLKSTDTQIGEWINVIGYVQECEVKLGHKAVRVQAIMLWSDGNIKLADYEKAVKERKEAE